MASKQLRAASIEDLARKAWRYARLNPSMFRSEKQTAAMWLEFALQERRPYLRPWAWPKRKPGLLRVLLLASLVEVGVVPFRLAHALLRLRLPRLARTAYRKGMA